MKVRSKITAKYQITIPREVRSRLKLDVTDVVEWEVGEEGIRVQAASKPLLKHQGELDAGSADAKADIRKAWELRAKRYRK